MSDTIPRAALRPPWQPGTATTGDTPPGTATTGDAPPGTAATAAA